MVDFNVEATVAASVRAHIEAHLATVDLNTLISETLAKQINNVTMNLTAKIFNDIVSNRDLNSEVTGLVNNIIADQLVEIGKTMVAEKIDNNSVKELLQEKLAAEVTRIATEFKFPNQSIPFRAIDMSEAKINADQIDGVIGHFTSSGIVDNATTTQLLVTDDGIVTTNNITATNILIDENTFVKNVVIDGSLTINGGVNGSNSFDEYINDIAKNAASGVMSNGDIDIANRSIVFGDRVIINSDSLGPQIVNSNLRKVGSLSELQVDGQASIADTLAVTDKKVGINTESPSGALSVWDEDSEFTLVKISPKNIFAGSTRGSDITLGSNNKNQIVLKNDGMIEINAPIRFNGVVVRITDRIPELVGEPGEIAIMGDGSAIYRCLGQTTWAKIL
jgi:hypothetical protein